MADNEGAWRGFFPPQPPLLAAAAHSDVYPVTASQAPSSMRDAVLTKNMAVLRIRTDDGGTAVRKGASGCGEIEWLLRNCAASGRDDSGALPECYWAGSKELSVACWYPPLISPGPTSRIMKA